jgi:hypothetical protein
VADLKEQQAILEEKLKESLSHNQQLYTENLTIKSTLEQLNAHLKGVESKFESNKLELKTLAKKNSLKVIIVL